MSSPRLASLLCLALLVSLSSMCFLAYRLTLSSTVTPARWCLATFAPILVVAYGLLRRSLDASGALAALYVGVVLTLAHIGFFLALLCFFLSASKATKYKQDEKRKLEGKHFVEGGRRNWLQVCCNGGVATYLAAIYLLDVGSEDLPLNFSLHYRASGLSAAVLGAVACCNGDTWASEIGSVWSDAAPRLITTGRRVPRGTNGGVTLVGLVVSLLGGMFVGLGFWAGVAVMAPAGALRESQPQAWAVLLGGFAGLFGSVTDSVLGAALQYSGVDAEGVIVETPREAVKHVSGVAVLNNHGVNLVASVVTAAATAKLAEQWFY